MIQSAGILASPFRLSLLESNEDLLLVVLMVACPERPLEGVDHRGELLIITTYNLFKWCTNILRYAGNAGSQKVLDRGDRCSALLIAEVPCADLLPCLNSAAGSGPLLLAPSPSRCEKSELLVLVRLRSPVFAEVRDRLESIVAPQGQPFLSQLFYLLEPAEIGEPERRGLLDQIDVLARFELEVLPRQELEPIEDRDVHLEDKPGERCMRVSISGSGRHRMHRFYS